MKARTFVASDLALQDREVAHGRNAAACVGTKWHQPRRTVVARSLLERELARIQSDLFHRLRSRERSSSRERKLVEAGVPRALLRSCVAAP